MRGNCQIWNIIFFTRERNSRREMTSEMSKYYHASLTPGPSCPHCNKICRSIMESPQDTHDRHLKDAILISMHRWWWLYVLSKVSLPSSPRYCVTVHIRVAVVFGVCRSPCQCHCAHGGLVQFCILYHHGVREQTVLFPQLISFMWRYLACYVWCNCSRYASRIYG